MIWWDFSKQESWETSWGVTNGPKLFGGIFRNKKVGRLHGESLMDPNFSWRGVGGGGGGGGGGGNNAPMVPLPMITESTECGKCQLGTLLNMYHVGLVE